MEWTENGPVRATLEIEREVMDTVIRQQIHFYAKDRRIDFETYVDWKFAEHVLKVHFPADVHSDEATYDIQFGNVTRKLHTNTSWDQARFEVCGHKCRSLRGRLRRQPDERLQVRLFHEGPCDNTDPDQIRNRAESDRRPGRTFLYLLSVSARRNMARGRYGTGSTEPERAGKSCFQCGRKRPYGIPVRGQAQRCA